MFSPQDELAVSEAAMRANMQRMTKAAEPTRSGTPRLTFWAPSHYTLDVTEEIARQAATRSLSRRSLR